MDSPPHSPAISEDGYYSDDEPEEANFRLELREQRLIDGALKQAQAMGPLQPGDLLPPFGGSI